MRVTPSSYGFTALGDTIRLSATPYDEGGGALPDPVDTWRSDDDGVADVGPGGLVTAVGPGTATVTAVIDGVEGTASIAVEQDVAAVSLTITPSTLRSLGESVTADVVVVDVGGSAVETYDVGWASSDPTVATVAGEGVITAVGNGTSEISAVVDGVADTVEVAVNQRGVALSFVVDPSDQLSDGPFRPVVQVELQDARGNRVTNGADDVQLDLASNPSAATLVGTTSVAATGGVASFPDVAVDRSGTGYTLRALSPDVQPDTSAAFDISPSPFAYVADNADGTVSVVQISTEKVVDVVGVGSRPYGVAIHPDGGEVYVTNGTSNTVSVLETAGNSVVATVPVGEAPRGVAVTPDGAYALVGHGNINQDSIWFVDTSTHSVTSKVETSRGNEGIAVSSDGSRAYVVAFSDQAVAILDLPSRSLSKTIAVGYQPRRVALSPDGSRAYVTNGGDDNVSIIDTSTDAVVDVVDTPANPVDVAVTPDGAYVYVTHFPFSEEVSVIDVGTSVVIDTIQVGGTPHGLAMGPYERFVYVTHDPASVSVIDLQTREVVSTFSVGGNPLGIVVGLTDASR